MKKVLLRAPETANEIIISYPFFHLLRGELPDAEINVIVNDDVVSYLLPLDLNLKVYPFPKEKNTLPGIHHFAVNLLDVFNIDTYFDLSHNFKSAFMGLCFRASERVGYKDGVKKYLFNKGIVYPENSALQYDRNILLLEKYFEKDFFNEKVMEKIELPPKNIIPFEKKDAEEVKNEEEIQEVDRGYIVIVKESGKDDSLWSEFVESFDNQKFRIHHFGGDNPDQEIALKSERNAIIHHTTNNLMDLKSDIVESKGVISTLGSIVNYSSYLGVDAFYLTRSPSSFRTAQNFKLSPYLIHHNGKTPLALRGRGEQSEVKSWEELIDLIYAILSL